MRQMATVIAPRTPDHPKTTSWEVAAWLRTTGSRSQVVIHFTNLTEAGGSSAYTGTLLLRLAMPPGLGREVEAAAYAGGEAELGAKLLSPYTMSELSAANATVVSSNPSILFDIHITQPPAYGVAVVALAGGTAGR
jgi:hypothetical protein